MIAIIGCGFVGLSTAHYFKDADKVLIDTDINVLEQIKQGSHALLNEHNVQLNNVFNLSSDLVQADLYLLCLPTPLNEQGELNTEILDKVISDIRLISDSKIIIRSTVPIGYCDLNKVHHFPEFLTEANPFNLNIDRIVITTDTEYLLFRECENIIKVSNIESEMIKLYSNAYLSMRLAFFSELNQHSNSFNINSMNIINAVCMDHRIGNHYNQKPFKISGNCLPKDLKHLSHESGAEIFKVLEGYIS